MVCNKFKYGRTRLEFIPKQKKTKQKNLAESVFQQMCMW